MEQKSRKKCPICKGCTWWLSHKDKYTVCHFCKKVYRLLPGNKLKEVEFSEVSGNLQ